MSPNKIESPAPLPVAQSQAGSPVLADWTPANVKAQLDGIKELMQACMIEGEDYGTIPGCKKPSLYKSGAEKLGLMFRLAPSFEITVHNLEGGHRDISVVCKITHIPTGAVMGSGVGSCSTLEAKYRWRNGERSCPSCAKATIIKGKAEYGGGWLCFAKKGGCGVKFKDGDPAIEAQQVGRVENPDIADHYNTVLKMAKKRAEVDAKLTVTAGSQLFTQDVEDMQPGAVATDVEVIKESATTAAVEETTEAKDVRKRANICNTIDALSIVKQACKESGGAWWTAQINDILNARYKAITGTDAPSTKEGGAN